LKTIGRNLMSANQKKSTIDKEKEEKKHMSDEVEIVQAPDEQNGGQVQTQTTDQDSLKDPVIEVVVDNTGEIGQPTDSGATISGEGGGSAVGDIVNVAKFAWEVMKDNVPVANQATDNANALPSGANFTDLSGWNSDPRVMKLHYHCENVLGFNTTDIDLTCEWYFNGQYNGVGQYINAATVLASGDVSVGSTINIKASISNPMNMGTPSNPVAGLPVRITIEQTTKAMQNFTTVYSGLLKGNGGGVLKPA